MRLYILTYIASPKLPSISQNMPSTSIFQGMKYVCYKEYYFILQYYTNMHFRDIIFFLLKLEWFKIVDFNFL